MIVSSINFRGNVKNTKNGIEITNTNQECTQIDHKNDNNLWQKAVENEMKNVSVTFEIVDDNIASPIGWTKSSGHLIFVVKMDFTWKAKWIKDGHKTTDPEQPTFAGVVSRESVRIALTYAGLNNIQVVAADIKMYISKPLRQRNTI